MSQVAGPSSAGGLLVGKRQIIRSQSRKIIYNVYNFLKRLSSADELAKIDLTKTRELTVQACGIGSVETVSRICSEASESFLQQGVEIFQSPRKKHNVPKSVTNLDDFEKDVLRRTILKMYDEGQYPTAQKLTLEMRKEINYKGSVNSMYRIFKNIGFRYRKGNDGRKFLMERRDIIGTRVSFLRKMHNLRASGDKRPRIYLDETWVNQNHSKKFIWQDSKGNGGLKVPVGKGSRLIVCHAGSADTGFIPGSKWIFRSKQKAKQADYHSEMNSESFKFWFQNKFLNLLEEGSVIIMDNASYHSALLDKVPNSNTKKKEIQEWLHHKHIQFHPTETIPELLGKVQPYKSCEKSYELDKIANEMGHEVIRLPPYHCQYNPIELIWARVKGEVADKNRTFRLADVEKLMHEAIDRLKKETWESCVRHAEQLQEEDFRKEVVRDEILEKIIINLRDNSDTDGDSEVSNMEVDEDDNVPLAMPLS